MLTAVLVALSIGLVLQPFAIKFLRRRGVLDHPSERSSHVAATPRGGGVVVVLALVLGTLAGGAIREPPTVVLLAVTVLCALVGVVEDVRGVRVVQRFVLLLLALIPLVLLADGGGLHVVLLGLVSVGVSVAYVNAFNFMDGVNGIASAQALVASAVMCILAVSADVDYVAVTGLALIGAVLGFLPFNARKAHIFLGDSGSYGLGAAIACAAIILVNNGVPLEAAAGATAITWADTGSTLVRRYRQGAVWYLPHRTHVYQRLTEAGLSHVQVAVLVGFASSLCAVFGFFSLYGNQHRVVGDLAIVTIVVVYLRLPRILNSLHPRIHRGNAAGGRYRGTSQST